VTREDSLLGYFCQGADRFQKRVQKYNKRGVYTPAVLDDSVISSISDILAVSSCPNVIF